MSATDRTSLYRTNRSPIASRIKRSLQSRGFVGTLGRCIMKPFYIARDYPPSRLRRIYMARAFDREFGVETADWVALKLLDIKSPNWKDGLSYDPIPTELFHDAIPHIRYEDFTFLDLGSGKGKALLLASEFPFKKIVGVDFSSELNAIAQQNIRNYKSTTQRCKDVQIICADVTSFSLPAEQAVLFCYHPFGERVMIQFLETLRRSLEDDPRQIVIVYCNPVLGSLFERAEFLKTIRATTMYSVYTNADAITGTPANIAS